MAGASWLEVVSHTSQVGRAWAWGRAGCLASSAVAAGTARLLEATLPAAGRAGSRLLSAASPLAPQKLGWVDPAFEMAVFSEDQLSREVYRQQLGAALGQGPQILLGVGITDPQVGAPGGAGPGGGPGLLGDLPAPPERCSRARSSPGAAPRPARCGRATKRRPSSC
jgi:hypothetical protein